MSHFLEKKKKKKRTLCRSRTWQQSIEFIYFYLFHGSVRRKSLEGYCAKENTHTLSHAHTHTLMCTHKLLTFLQLINFILQSSFKTIRIPWRNDFPIKGDPTEERLFISDSWCSLFQSLKLELIFQFRHWLLWTHQIGDPNKSAFWNICHGEVSFIHW